MSQQDPYQSGPNPYGQDPYTQGPYGQNPQYGEPSYGTDPYSATPYSADPYTSQQYGSDPYGSYQQTPTQQWPDANQYSYDQQSPYGVAQPYGQNSYQSAAMQPYNNVWVAPDHPQSTTVLVLGLIGIIFFQLLCPVAWYLGNKAHKEVLANPQLYSEPGTLKAGRILGIVGTAFLGVGLAFVLVMLMVSLLAYS